jgi:hypothetical protein
VGGSFSGEIQLVFVTLSQLWRDRIMSKKSVNYQQTRLWVIQTAARIVIKCRRGMMLSR